MNRCIDELQDFNDNDLLSYLKNDWDINTHDEIEVIGELKRIIGKNNRPSLVLKSVKGLNGEALEYPISDLHYKETLLQRGLSVAGYVDINDDINLLLDKTNTAIVKTRLELASPSERLKNKNPLLLETEYKNVQLLKQIDNKDIALDKEGNALIEKTIYNQLYQINKAKFEPEILVEIESEKERLSREIKESHEQKKLEIEEAILKLEQNLNSLTVEEETVKGSLRSIEGKVATTSKKLQEQDKSLSQAIQKSKVKKTELLNEIQIIKEQLKAEKENHMKMLEKLNAFVKSQADTLLGLEFIDENIYSQIVMEPQNDDRRDSLLSFNDDFKGNYKTATAHIQAYLYNKDIMYPRHILENYFALLQTNDLIILAGESGSGKTNLVKSFAEAVGGVSKIVPVKPNWTSSEDLLGYYNPLEKKYLSTPFLEALLEASQNPDVPYFICLDEMNLARVEYYFADFLSLLEERDGSPEIHLYADDESSHVLSEFKHVLEIIDEVKSKYKKGNIINFVELLKDEDINQELKRIFGFSDKDSLIKYHSDLRRMISGVISIPSSIVFPQNVRIIGAINIDETTHYLSPKILDRAHIVKFDSPLLFDWAQIESEISTKHDANKAIKFEAHEFDDRNKYPRFDRENEFCLTLAGLTKSFFTPMGVEVGLRTIRQGLNYQNKLGEFSDNADLFINNFFLQKILPKLTFDGNKMYGDKELKDLLLQLQAQLHPHIIKSRVISSDGIDALEEFEILVGKAKINDWIVNYWA
ncbi:McrB family protein [Litorilituus sediminis]|uniref:Restriction endonuclease n=1 Tax=Litorilituus sediminis TaxID=718192 RepID=A0A4P6P156_9GAMM|nr:AAA family ATPase [Litorilituus sediminis]QBG34791.1 restriction endonuclease [Litorilituus sediminis]